MNTARRCAHGAQSNRFFRRPGLLGIACREGLPEQASAHVLEALARLQE